MAQSAHAQLSLYGSQRSSLLHASQNGLLLQTSHTQSLTISSALSQASLQPAQEQVASS